MFPNKTESGDSSVMGIVQVMWSYHVGLKIEAVAEKDWDNKAKIEISGSTFVLS